MGKYGGKDVGQNEQKWWKWLRKVDVEIGNFVLEVCSQQLKRGIM